MAQKTDLAKRAPAEEKGDGEYDLKASTKEIGQLYPVLKAADGEILDGFNRTQSDASWKSLVLENIDTEEKKIIARLVANFHRRQITYEEKASWINSLAASYEKQGLKVEGKRTTAQGPNQIINRICAATGLARRTVMEYLDPRFKQQAMKRVDPGQHETRSDPETVVFNSLKMGRRETYALEVVQRFKEKHEADLLKSPLFRKKVLDLLPPGKRLPIKQALSFDPYKEEDIQALMRVDPDQLLPEDERREHPRGRGRYLGRRARRRKDQARAQEGYEPAPSLYEEFTKDCPQCACPTCPHAGTCIERIRPED